MKTTKTVMLYSGGFDSFCLKEIYKPDIILTINTGTKYGNKEIELLKNTMKDKANWILLDGTFLQQFELENKIVPFRNNFFILMAAQFANRIYIGTTIGDRTKDKDFVFKAQMEGILNYFSLDKDRVKVQDYPYEVLMPFKEMTKTQIIKKYLENDGSVERLLKETRSCYKDEIKPCGLCKACLRNAIALVNNDIDITGIFENNPFENITKEIDITMKSRGIEKYDYINALNKINSF